MKEMPIEASVDEFVDLIDEHAYGTVTCWTCGGNEWDTFVDTPTALFTTTLRIDALEDERIGGLHVVKFVCRRCGLLRLHHVNVGLPREA